MKQLSCPKIIKSQPFTFLFFNFYKDINPFCGVTDTPVLDLMSPLGFKARVGRIICIQ